MPNTLTNIKYKIVAGALMTLRERCIMPSLVNSDYSTTAAEKGDVINVPIPTAVGIRDVAPSKLDEDAVDSSFDNVQINLDQWKQTDPIYLTDKEILEVDANRFFIPMKVQEAMKALANYINSTIHAEYVSSDRGVYGVVGTAGTTPFGSGVTVASATQARKVLNQQLCPRTDRRGVLDFTAEAAALELPAFSDAEKVGTDQIKIQGEIGRKFGIDWYADDAVPTHTAGTIANASAARECAVNNSGGYAAGVSTINVDNGGSASVTGTIRVGDIISFAGHTQTYCVIPNSTSAQYNGTTKQYTFATNAITGLSFYPALKASVADNAVITVRATHVVNSVFHRDAIAFAMRPLASGPASLGLDQDANITTMQDPQTGLTIRLETKRQNKRWTWEFDALWGVKLVRPELAVRVMG